MKSAKEERHLSAIMFTDMVGYTSLSQSDERLALELLEEHKRILRPLFPIHGGTEIKTVGDAFLVEFRSARDAVLCAVDVQKNLRERNSRVPASRRVEVKIGIHVGDVEESSGDVYGDAVNVASRIEPISEAGGVCISQQVFDSVRNKTDLKMIGLGEKQLKNIELPLAVYKVNMPWDEPERRSQSAPKERLAVLPFVNISPDPNDEFFADGLTEEMITKLSEVGGLKVIARTSVMNYKKKEKNAADIGRELGVGSIVEGSVRKAGNKIRVTVQLVDAHTEEHLWASNYDKELDDIFAIQSDIASKVANSLSSGVLTGRGQKDTDDIEAYTFYLRGLQLYHERTEQSLREALDLLSKAVSRDPGFARAQAAMAATWVLMALQGYEDYSVITDKGEVAAKKAIELGPEVAEGHAALAQVHWTMDRFKECLSEVEKAITLNPNLADSYLSMAVAQSSMGLLAEGLKAGEKAHELDPLSTRFMAQLAWIYRAAERYDDALAILRKMMQLDPRNVRTYHAFIDHYLWVGDYDRAAEMLKKALGMRIDDPMIRLDQGLLYALTGRRKEAGELVELLRAEKKESVRAYSLLFMYSALGDLDEAFSNLMRTAKIHSWPAHIKYTPVFSELRKDPRFQEFCGMVGLPPSLGEPLG